jgi:hypothetical protein
VYPAETLKLPSAAVVSIVASSAVWAEPFPELPAAYSWTNAPLTAPEAAMTLPAKATPATGVLVGQEAGVFELTLGVQPPPPPPPPPVETVPPHPDNIAQRGMTKKAMAKKGAAKETEIEKESGCERWMRGSFTVVFPIPG